MATSDERPAFDGRRWWRIARTPRWIGALLLVMAIAATFAALAQWQLGRAVLTATTEKLDTEKTLPLSQVDRPQTAVTGDEAGRRVTISGALVPGDTVVLSDRVRVGTAGEVDGQTGFWVVGHLVDDSGDSLAVALGWTATRAAAEKAAADLDAAPRSIHGRYLPGEAPTEDEFEEGQRSALAPSALINEWAEVGPVYGGYVVDDEPIAGTRQIVAPPPEQDAALNVLNIFYAIEWVIFAGFAFYLWYRLVRDAMEREILAEREAEEAAAGATAGASSAATSSPGRAAGEPPSRP
jgi:surfeit locus 1 family protein